MTLVEEERPEAPSTEERVAHAEEPLTEVHRLDRRGIPAAVAIELPEVEDEKEVLERAARAAREAAEEIARRQEERRAERRARKKEKRRRRGEEAERAVAPLPRRAPNEVVGTITVRPEGYGFLKRLEGPPGDDVFLPPEELRGVMDGDRLRVGIVPGRHGREAGVLLDVLDRRRRHLLGTFHRRGRTTWVIPVDPTLPRFVPVRAPYDLMDGQVVKVVITQYPDEGMSLLGEVDKVVGDPGDPLVAVLEAAYSHGFAEDFPSDVRAEADRIPEYVTDVEAAGRRDLRKMRLVTIDGADARDFDDAVFVEPRPRGGYRLTVAIADVAHYVREGTRLDEEALHRATSVYFPNHVLPMLPERLSNGICSLNPHVDRLCMVCAIDFDSAGRPQSAEVFEGLMRSHARCTYEQVAAILEGESVPELEHVRADLHLAGELAEKLRQRRRERGSLDFDLPESRAVLDEKMRVQEIVRRDRNDAHRLIEEFMLAANEAVARHFSSRGLPTVYRVHGEPDIEKLQLFVNLAQAVGFFFDLEQGISPVKLGGWLAEIEGSAQQKALNTLLLRSMMQAVYTPENIGHFGLGAEHYLHFTSPIRRYPDLIVHRLLKAHFARGDRALGMRESEAIEQELDELAAHSSQRERAAMEAERDIDAYFKCLYLEPRIGETHDATVVSITDFGFFAELDAFPVEGLVRADELGDDWELDVDRYRLVFGDGRSFGIGEKIRVQIAAVDLEKRQINFFLLGEADVSVSRPKSPWQRQRPTRAPSRFGRKESTAPPAGGVRRESPRGAGGEGGPSASSSPSRFARGERPSWGAPAKGRRDESPKKKGKKKGRPGRRERAARRRR